MISFLSGIALRLLPTSEHPYSKPLLTSTKSGRIEAFLSATVDTPEIPLSLLIRLDVATDVWFLNKIVTS